MSSQDVPTVLQIYTNCVNFTAVKHRNQRRLDSDKTPYINHPIGMFRKTKKNTFFCKFVYF